MHESTEAVHVNSAVVTLASEDFRGDVSLGAHVQVCSFVGRRQLNCATEVAKFERGLVSLNARDQNVIDLDVAMHDIERVKCAKASGNLFDDLLSVFFLEWLILLLANVVEKVSSLHEIVNDVVVLLILKCFDCVDEIVALVVLEEFAKLDLSKVLAAVSVCLFDVSLADELDRNLHG